MKSNRSIQLALAIGALAVVPALAAAQTGDTSSQKQREPGASGAAQGGAQHQGNKPGASGEQRGQQHGNKPGSSGGQRAQQQGQSQKKQALKLQEEISFPVEEGCTYTASVKGRIEPVAAGKSQQPSGSQSGGANLGRGGAGVQGQTGGAAQGPAGGSGEAHAHAGAAQERARDASGSQAGGAQAGGAQAGIQPHEGAQAGKAQGGGQAGQVAGYEEKVKPNLAVSASVSCPNAPELRVTDTLKSDTSVSRSELQEMISRRTSIATEKGGRFCMYVPQFELTREKLSGTGIAQLCRVPAAAEKGGMP